MAELPPKIPPTITQNWPSFPHDKPSLFSNSTTTTTFINGSIQQQQHNHGSWVDEFLDFSSARRGDHRRSLSDSIAFLEQPLCRDSNAMMMTTTTKQTDMFDRLDNDQLMSLFSDDAPGLVAAAPPTLSSSNPSTPSDQNSNNDEKSAPSMDLQQPKNEPGEVESLRKLSAAEAPPSSNGDSIYDPKRVKRILANRQSAQRSRVRKLQYISQLERSVTTLQSEVSTLSPRVAFLDHQRLILNVDNSALKQRIAALAQDKIFKDAHQEALKKEIERLRQVYQQQQLKNMNTTATNNHHAPPQQQPSSPPQNEEQLDQMKGER